MEDIVLSVSGLSKRFSGKPALNGLELTVPRRSAFALIGDVGAGKTTLMRILTGLIHQDAGEFCMLGEKNSLPRNKVGALVDSPACYGELSIKQNLMAQAIVAGGRNRVAQLMELMDIQPSRTGRGPIRSLSGGVKQCFGLACAFVGAPELALLDEPFGGLDTDTGAKFRSLLSQELERGATVLMTGAFVADIWPAATHIAFMDMGRIVFAGEKAAWGFDGTPDEKAFREAAKRLGEEAGA